MNDFFKFSYAEIVCFIIKIPAADVMKLNSLNQE